MSDQDPVVEPPFGSSVDPPAGMSSALPPGAAPLGAVSGDVAVVSARLVELEHERRRVEGEIALLVAAVERSGVYGHDGHQSVSGWIRAHSRCQNAEATSRRQVGRLAHADARFAAALVSGRLGVAQARRLGRAFAHPRCGDQLHEVLGVLLEHAQRLSFDEFTRVVNHWERLADTDGAERNAAAAHDARSAHVSVVGDEIHVRANGGLAQGSVIAEIFGRYCDAEFHTDWDQNRELHGEDATAATMPRTDTQRRFDALYRICVDAAGATPAGRDPEPLVNLVVDIATLDELLNNTPTVTAPQDPRARRCETTTGIPIPTADMIAAVMWGRIRRVVVDTAGVVVDMGRVTRLFTGRARDAVMLASTTCVMAGCNVPVTSCQADHHTEWHHGGCTDQHNGGPLCRHHNRFKTRHRYRVHRDPNGYWHTYRPDGTELTDHHPPRTAT